MSKKIQENLIYIFHLDFFHQGALKYIFYQNNLLDYKFIFKDSLYYFNFSKNHILMNKEFQNLYLNFFSNF